MDKPIAAVAHDAGVLLLIVELRLAAGAPTVLFDLVRADSQGAKICRFFPPVRSACVY